jgi:flagellar hook-basal body complex protein FliE
MQIEQLTGLSAVQQDYAAMPAKNRQEPSPNAAATDRPFKNTLQQMVQDIDQLQKQLDQSINRLTTPEQTNIEQKMHTADSTYDLMMGVKDRLISAYRVISP